MKTTIFVADVTFLKNDKLLNKLLKRLPTNFYDKIINISNEKQRLLSLGGRILLYNAIKEGYISGEELIYKENQKPYINNSKKFFNITHSNSIVSLIVSEDEVGIDVERIKKANLKVATRFFCKNEIDFIDSSRDKNDAFFTLWVRKESLLKAVGVGIKGGLSSIDVSDFTLNKCDYDGVRYYFKEYFLEGFKLCACSKNNEFLDDYIKVNFDKI